MAKKKDVVDRNTDENKMGSLDQLDLAIKAITKKYGDVVSSLEDHGDVHIPTISTGCLSLDIALGNGGMGLGRIYEIYGPNSGGKSTLAVNVIIQAQRRGLKCCYIDAEHAVDPKLFRDYGVDTKKLEIVQGYDGEQNLDILERFVQTGAFSVAVVDSVSALVPRVEAEAGIDENQMGLHARLMSKALRKITPVANQTKTLIIFINQLRMKIGGYGCFHYDTLVNFTDGRSLPIGKVVDSKIDGNVWCINEITREFESKPITGWHDNGIVDNSSGFIHIQTSSIDGKGRFGFTCTPEHKILTDTGWVEAKYITIGSRIVSKYTETINGTYRDFLSGCLVGDSHISIREKNTGSLRLQDNSNPDYLLWKIGKLSAINKFVKTSVGKGDRYDSEYTYEFAKVKRELSDRDPMFLLNNYSDVGFALWIMDDGNYDNSDGHSRYSLSIKRYRENNAKLEQISNKLCDVGFGCSHDAKSGTIYFKVEASELIANAICKYVPESMQYKLPIHHRGKYEEFELCNEEKSSIDYVSVKEIRFASARQMRQKRKFDISVEGNHNYMVGGYRNGVVVHNSPETTTGGEALAFYSTGRISVRGPEARSRRIPDPITGEIMGHTTEFEIIKNKLAAPFRKAEVKLIYGQGYDAYWEILDMATSLGVIDKAGAWFKYNGENFAQGELKAVAHLKAEENKEFYLKIRNEVMESIGLKEAYESHSNPGALYS